MSGIRRRTFLAAGAGAVALVTLPGTAAAASGPLCPVEPTTEYLDSPVGIDVSAPKFGWRLTGNGEGRAQTAYQLTVAGIWDSGKISSAEQTAIAYAGPPLAARTRYSWSVRVWDETGTVGPWSAPAEFETALLSEQDWIADWIGTGIVQPQPFLVVPQTEAFEGTTLAAGHTLGQSFLSTSPLAAIVISLTADPVMPSGCTLVLRENDPDGAIMAGTTVGGLLGPAVAQLDFPAPLAPGRFYLELSAPQGSISWLGTSAGVYGDGSAYADGASVAGARMTTGVPPAAGADPVLRTEFSLAAPVASARLYLAGLGYSIAWLNGQQVGDDTVLSPPWTDYRKRVFYTTHDVTALIRPGGNALGVALGRGFFGTRVPDTKDLYRQPWIAEPLLRAQLEVALVDGRRITVASGPDWQLTDGPTTYDSVFAGESYDARIAAALGAWTSPGYGAIGWRAASTIDGPGGVMRAFAAEPIRAGADIPAVGMTMPAPGVRVFDFGVTLAGWARLTANFAAGTTVRLCYGEKLDANGRVDVETPDGFDNPSVVDRFQVDEYTAAGGTETWTPSFTYKGFRYVEVTGAPPDLTLTAIPVHSDVPSTMDLTLPDPVLQWLVDASGRTALNNLPGQPTDSPTYSKLGWTGDTRFASQPMLYRFGMAGLFAKWLEDIRLTQGPSGQIDMVAPFGDPPDPGSVSPTWTGVYPQLVRQYWLIYGDASIPATHFDAVSRYLGWLLSTVQDDIATEQLGDWLPPGGVFPPEGGQLVGTVYVIRALQDGIALAGLLGHADQVTQWQQRLDAITARFNAVFFDPAKGYYTTGATTDYRQTSNAVPLALGLVPEANAASVFASLVADVETRGRHLNTGCVGSLYLPFALSDNGRADLAEAVLAQTTYPSYGYLRGLGATTLWEGWEATVRSHDHFLLSGPVQWLVERVLGVEPLAPGWARFRVAPRAFATLPSASIGLDTVRGRIEVAWQQHNGQRKLDLTVPVNAVAEVSLGAGQPVAVGSGQYRFATP